MAEFKPSDVVQVISGGPRMTITSVGESMGEMTAWCVWFDGTKQMNGAFPVTAIKHSPEPQPASYNPRR